MQPGYSRDRDNDHHRGSRPRGRGDGEQAFRGSRGDRDVHQGSQSYGSRSRNSGGSGGREHSAASRRDGVRIPASYPQGHLGAAKAGQEQEPHALKPLGAPRAHAAPRAGGNPHLPQPAASSSAPGNGAGLAAANAPEAGPVAVNRGAAAPAPRSWAALVVHGKQPVAEAPSGNGKVSPSNSGGAVPAAAPASAADSNSIAGAPDPPITEQQAGKPAEQHAMPPPAAPPTNAPAATLGTEEERDIAGSSVPLQQPGSAPGDASLASLPEAPSLAGASTAATAATKGAAGSGGAAKSPSPEPAAPAKPAGPAKAVAGTPTSSAARTPATAAASSARKSWADVAKRQQQQQQQQQRSPPPAAPSSPGIVPAADTPESQAAAPVPAGSSPEPPAEPAAAAAASYMPAAHESKPSEQPSVQPQQPPEVEQRPAPQQPVLPQPQQQQQPSFQPNEQPGAVQPEPQPQEQRPREEVGPAVVGHLAQGLAPGSPPLPSVTPVAVSVPAGMPVPMPRPPLHPGAMPPPHAAYFLGPGGAMPPLLPAKSSGSPFIPPHPGMGVPPQALGLHVPPQGAPPMDMGMPPPVVAPAGMPAPHPGVIPLPPHPHAHPWGRGGPPFAGHPAQPFHLPPPVHHPAAPLAGPHGMHPTVVPQHLPPHAPGAPPAWAPHAAPMQPMRPSWGRGTPVSPRSSLAGRQGVANASGAASPLNPHSAVFMPSGRAASPPVPAASATASPPLPAVEQPAQQQSASLRDAPPSPSPGEVPWSASVEPQDAQQPHSSPSLPAAPPAAVLGPASSLPQQQTAEALVQPAAVPAAACTAQPAQQEQSCSSPPEQQQPEGPTATAAAAAAPAPAPETGQAAEAAGPALLAAADSAVSTQQPASAAPAAAEKPPSAAASPAAPKSWAALAASQAAAPVVHYRPHTAPQRAPGQAPPSAQQQQQQRQQQHSAGLGAHGGRGHASGSGGRGRGSGGRGHCPHAGGRDSQDHLPHHHQQRGPSSGQSSSASAARAQRPATNPSTAPTSPAAASVVPAAAAPAASPAAAAPAASASSAPSAALPKALWPLASGLEATAAPPRMQPRGLANPGNLCFMNSILQALMGSSRFCQLLAGLQEAADELDPASAPTLCALAALAQEFKPAEQSNEQPEGAARDAAGSNGKKASSPALQLSDRHPLMPIMLMELVNSFRPQGGASGGGAANVVLGARGPNGNAALALTPRLEQEDAHDFLEYLVDRAHGELARLAADGDAAPPSPTAGAAGSAAAEDDEWLTRSGRRATKRQSLRTDRESAVSALLRGTTLSTVTCQGHPPSETPQPFVSLTLHILPDSVRSVDDALDLLTATEGISGYRPQDGAPPTEATKAVRLQRLPPLLVLFLMRFDPANLHQKISKHVAFPPRLRMKRMWLAPDAERGSGGVEYELVSTVTHHGKTIGSGHYTADVRQPGDKWLHFDDGNVWEVSQQQVLTARPYLLFYQRAHH